MTKSNINSWQGAVAALLSVAMVAQAQQLPSNTAQTASTGSAATSPQVSASGAKQPSSSDKRRAAKLYLSAAKLYQNQKFEEALRENQQAAALDPTNPDYALAVQIARSHAATALMQAAARDRTRGDEIAAHAALAHALELDPLNADVLEHLHEAGDDVAEQNAMPGGSQEFNFAGPEHVSPGANLHSFHLRSLQREVIEQVFKAYGIDATIDSSIPMAPVRLDLDDANFAQATRAVAAVTHSFYVPVDPHRVLVARDTTELRQQFTRNALETVPLAGMTTTEITDIGNIARTVFEVPQEAVNTTAGTLTLRAPESTLNAFNSTLRNLDEGRGEVLIDVRLIQLAHTHERNTGIQPPQAITAFNVYAEEQSILNANQALVQQIISSGLAAPGDTLAILGILLASGQVSSALFSNGIALFGGGLTLSALSPGPAKANLNLNSSDSRELDDYRLRLEDGEEGTLRSGSRYPIMTSSFSSLGASSLNIPGLTSAGLSSTLTSALASLAGAATSVPQVQYQDLGLTLKATPRVLRSGEVALSMDIKITALAGASINGVPILGNRAYSGVATLRANEAIVVMSEMDKNESRAISGLPGLSEIPGLNNITEKDVQSNTSSLLIIMTPHVIRNPHGVGHSPLLHVDRTGPGR